MSISKNDLYRLIDALPEKEHTIAKSFLEFLLSQKNPWRDLLENPPEVDEPLDIEDIKAMEEAERDIAEGNTQLWEDVKKELNN